MAITHFRSRFKAIGLTLVIALLATMGAVLAVSAHGGFSPGVIHTCVNNSSGEIKVVGDTDVCKGKQTPLDWNAVGPIGPAGADGADGAPGPAESTLVQGPTIGSAPDPLPGTTVEATATCPSGKVLLGGGGGVKTNGGPGAIALLASFPFSTTTWKAVGVSTKILAPPGTTFNVTAWALCSL